MKLKTWGGVVSVIDTVVNLYVGESPRPWPWFACKLLMGGGRVEAMYGGVHK